ncbi:NUDIX domain-containing protein [Streptomyces sp. NPDC048436]|uniref:NUDIX domain-containing protein n=1 Tax=Streptomyces sp. NPDC048436 TaxID=3365550 RepID=UPI0037134315
MRPAAPSSSTATGGSSTSTTRYLGKLSLLGGHNETVMPTFPTAALRELHEETGVPPRRRRALPEFTDVRLDIDVHGIDANPSKSEPEHQHVDFRWIYSLRSDHALTLQTKKVGDYEWRLFPHAASPTVRAKHALLP